jgi:hypothetical protein
MKFIELTNDETNEKILINISHIVSITDYQEYTRIQVLNEWYTVLETMDQLRKVLSYLVIHE